MTRVQFIDELRSKLNRLPAEELESALDYYNEIFFDAGEENEAETAAKLGSTDDIARQIYVENGIDPDGRPTFIMDDYVEPSKAEEPQREFTVNPPLIENFNVGKLLLIIPLVIICLPLLVVAIVLTFVFCIIGAVLEIVFAVIGVALIVDGIISTFSIPPVGITELGSGLVLVGLVGLTSKTVFGGCWRALTGVINKFANIGHGVYAGGVQNG